MFRIALPLILSLLLSDLAIAEDPVGTSVWADSVSAPNSEALEIMKDHMRSQLDWRSYFTNRMDARRRAVLSDEGMRREPRAADSTSTR